MVADGSWETDVKRRMVELGMRRVDVDAGIWETTSGRRMKDSDELALRAISRFPSAEV